MTNPRVETGRTEGDKLVYNTALVLSALCCLARAEFEEKYCGVLKSEPTSFAFDVLKNMFWLYSDVTSGSSNCFYRQVFYRLYRSVRTVLISSLDICHICPLARDDWSPGCSVASRAVHAGFRACCPRCVSQSWVWTAAAAAPAFRFDD